LAIICEIHRNWLTSALNSSEKMLNTLFIFIIYEETKVLAIIHDFTAHCAIKNEEMVQVLKFDSKSEFEEKNLWLYWIFSSNSDFESNFQNCTIHSFFIAQ
jgi:hypothetical protein